MNSRWEVNKIGLVDFWYYDEQEFHFVNGRMLLRGSNGSGKSVTMQSVVPLLLDGNMRPERLDPFGSRDRKMASYLLEENDERDERTGYLYMELKRRDSETYLTIGIGIRARKGKPLDSWYFYIADGRRINKDFYLYKETDGKITLTKKELSNRLLEGGKVLDTQQEYMEYVNKQIFGFDTVEAYKEMIDLLIQLRTPKLSKDFKPSVINEILSDSLQSLSDEDLRPMSEAIENMDTLSTNLSNKNVSKAAADKILRVYQKYNDYMLYQKARQHKQVREERNKLSSSIKSDQKQMASCEETIRRMEEKRNLLEAERRALDKEKDSLNASNAVYLKKQEQDLQSRIEGYGAAIADKEKQLQEKQDKWNELANRLKHDASVRDEKQDQILELLDQMGETIDDLTFDEHFFMKEEIQKELEAEYDYQLHANQLHELKKNVEAGIGVIKQAEEEKRRLEAQELKLDQEKRNRDAADKRVAEYEMQFAEIQNEWKESLYCWNGGNQELIISTEILSKISEFIEGYGKDSDYNQVRQLVGDEQFRLKAERSDQKNELQQAKQILDQEIKTVKEELEEWKNKKEPEPECEEAVKRNRKKLTELGIPFHQFYKVIDFDHRLKDEECDQLEEALLQMGILDALVVDEEYKDQVLAADPGMCDHYIFADVSHTADNLLNLLSISDDANDMFLNPKITRIIGSIASGSSGTTYINQNGAYGMGILTGTITREYQAKYIGVKAREAHRSQKIGELTDILGELEEKQRVLESDIQRVEQRIQLLYKEYQQFPSDSDIRQAYRDWIDGQEQLAKVLEEIKRLEDTISSMAEAIQEIWGQAVQLAGKLYLSCRLEVFLEAKDNLELYQKYFYQLQTEHVKYIQLCTNLTSIESSMQDCDMDMDTIRYDMGTSQRSLNIDKMELSSIQEQLKLTNYEEIKERLDVCLKRLQSIPDEVEQAIVSKEANSNIVKNLKENIEKNQSQKERLSRQVALLMNGLKAEWGLHYVETPFQTVEEMEEQADKLILLLENSSGNQDKEALLKNLNEVFFANREYLVEYNLTMDYLFQDGQEENESYDIQLKRIDIVSKYRGNKVKFQELVQYLKEEIEELHNLLKAGDRELFEDILANTISRKIRSKINKSYTWVEKMNQLMGSMNTSSGLKLSLRWKSRKAEYENQLDTQELVELLKKDSKIMKEEEFEKLSKHFRSKVEEARRHTRDGNGTVSFYAIMRETLDYRRWFEFQLYSQKSGEAKKELTNSVFGTFSGGEKAMAMYVPLFSAVVAKYQGARGDAPRIISLDEAFAGVDNKNIRDMFRLMVEFEFNFIINSQILWGDCDTLNSLAIYQLLRPENVKFVTVMSYIWNGKTKKSVEKIEDVMELEG